MKKAISVLGLILLFSNAHVQAVPIHKWIDKDGKVHYANVPPASGQKSMMLEYKGLGDTGATTQKAPKEKVEAPLDEEDLKKRAEAERANAKINCQRARETVQTLESGVRVSKINTKGEKEVLDEKGRKDELARAKAGIKDWCDN